MEITENKIRQYLLGSLSQEEIELFDLQIILNAALEERLLLAEEKLMEDYLEGTLSTAEKELFQKNFLASQERYAQLNQLSLLKNYAQKNLGLRGSANLTGENAALDLKPAERPTFFQKLKNLISTNLPLTATVTVLTIIGLILGLFIYQKGRENMGAGDEVASLNQKDLSDLSNYKNLSSLSLISGSFRSTAAGSNNVLKKDAASEYFLLRLALPTINNQNENSFNVRISAEEKLLARLDHLRSYNNQNGQELRLLLPSSHFQRGTYKIEVVPEGKNDVPFIFSFKVE